MPNKKIFKSYKLLILSLILPFVAGGIGSFATTPAIPNWYAGLEKPFFNPPNWIFGPVWTSLYLLMGISLYLIWSKAKKKDLKLIKIFLIHLIFNSLWSLVFFGLQNLSLALIVILILWVMIFYLIKAFWRINKTASCLLMPYLAWVSFATLLNFSILILN